MRHHLRPLLFTLILSAAASASASTSFDCTTVRFGQPDWTGVSIKAHTAAWILDQLGYETRLEWVALPTAYRGMANAELDVLLAQWLPSQREQFRPYGIEGSLDVLSPNLEGARYTIAVPAYVHDAGVTSLADLDEHKERFGGRIHGIEFGSGGNDTIQRMIEDDFAGLGDWELVGSSEPNMLAALEEHEKAGEWIAFLGWSPHPMNISHDIRYLSGGREYWGPNKGEVIVNTVTRRGLAWACPNLGQFLDDYDWTVQEQSLAMAHVANRGMSPLAAGRRIMRENPAMLERWFAGNGTYQTGRIRTIDGERAARQVIAEALGQ